MYNKLNDLLKQLDSILITSPHNLRYFTGFKGGEGVAVIGKNFRVLFVDSRYTVAAKSEATDFEVIEFSAGKLIDVIKEKLEQKNAHSIGFENSVMTVRDLERYRKKIANIDFIELDEKLNLLRMIKTNVEIDCLRRAEKIGDLAFERVLPKIKAGVAERDIAAELEYQMRLLGADGTSFETIVVSGIKSSMPHGRPDETKFKRGDFVTIDFGCIYDSYCSDMTRTVVIEKATDEQVKIYQTVLNAQLAGLEAIQEGIEGKEADAAARNVISDAGYGKFFGHSLGHGVGLQIHELPNLSPKSDIVLKENMVVTCEPGIYIEGLGGVRIEDMVVVRKSGIDNLTAFPKDLIICG